MVAWVLGLGVDANPAFFVARFALRKADDFLEGWDFKCAIQRLIAVPKLLYSPKSFDFRESEIGREVAFLFDAIDPRLAFSVAELATVLNVGCADDVGFVARDQVTVFGRDQIGFDIVRPLFDRECVGFQRVFR